MKTGSFYEATERCHVDVFETAKRSYTYNFKKLLPLDKEVKILDLGCSEGIAIEWLDDLGYVNVFGVDTDEVALDIAKKRLDQLEDNHFIYIDALQFLKHSEDQSFDFIMMLNVIEHIPKNIIFDMMIEIKRVLKPKGAFLAQTGNWENPLNIGLFTRDFTHEVMYTKNSLRQLMMMVGFSSSQIETGAICYEPILKNIIRNLLSFLCSWLVVKIAWIMRIRIREMAPMIYSFVRNN